VLLLQGFKKACAIEFRAKLTRILGAACQFDPELTDCTLNSSWLASFCSQRLTYAID
jgi:hypothetical protein